MFWRFCVLVMTGFLCSCASTQLNYNTLDIASTVGDIHQKQVLDNLSRFIDNPYALPSHVDLNTGTAGTNNSVNPAATAPFGSTTALTTALTSTLSGAPAVGSQITQAGTHTPIGLTLTASDQWSQSWAYTPITNSDELRRLRVLYRYALGYVTPAEFRDEYPVVRKAQNITYDKVRADGSGGIYCPAMNFTASTQRADVNTAYQGMLNDNEAKLQKQRDAKAATAKRIAAHAALQKLTQTGQTSGEVFEADQKALNDAETAEVKAEAAYKEANSKAAASRKAYAILEKAPADCTSIPVQTQVPDEAFLRQPGCVICIPSRYGIFTGREKDLALNPRLLPLRHWLFTESNKPESAKSLGHFGNHFLYVTPEGQQALSEFVLFVLEATEESAASANAGAGSASKIPSMTKNLYGQPAALIGGGSQTPTFLLAPPP